MWVVNPHGSFDLKNAYELAIANENPLLSQVSGFGNQKFLQRSNSLFGSVFTIS